jgi:hypothetical protein
VTAVALGVPGRGPGAVAAAHQCPAGRCPQLVPAGRLMCRGHWARVPRAARRAVRRSWAGGRGRGTAAHLAAVLAAITAAARTEAGR